KLLIAERRLAENSKRFKECERELSEARTLQGKCEADEEESELHHRLQMEQEAILKHQHYEQQRLYDLEKTKQMM
ncbi:jg2187, partial [Pararge aegeria aegeria]